MSQSIATPEDFEACRKIHKAYGKNYYFATRGFPEQMKLDTFALYAFFRVPDEMVDNPEDPNQAKEHLEAWKYRWAQDFKNKSSDHPVLRASMDVFFRNAIPFEYSEAFFEAMIQDTWKDRYQTYEELEEYMYGSAAVVGLMMSHVIGYSEDTALIYAAQLGYAMQLTNFIRDIQEDWDDRGRIYLPLEDLERFGVTEEDIRAHRHSDRLKALVQFEVSRARQLYAQADKGIPMLTQEGRLAVRMARVIYSAILVKLEQQNCNVFVGRASTNLVEKISIAGKIWMDQYRIVA